MSVAESFHCFTWVFCAKKVVFCEVMPVYIKKAALLSKNALIPLIPYYHRTHTIVLKIAEVMWKGKGDK